MSNFRARREHIGKTSIFLFVFLKHMKFRLFPMVPEVNPTQLDVQNPNLRPKPMENLRKTQFFRDEIFRETYVF